MPRNGLPGSIVGDYYPSRFMPLASVDARYCTDTQPSSGRQKPLGSWNPGNPGKAGKGCFVPPVFGHAVYPCRYSLVAGFAVPCMKEMFFNILLYLYCPSLPSDPCTLVAVIGIIACIEPSHVSIIQLLKFRLPVPRPPPNPSFNKSRLLRGLTDDIYPLPAPGTSPEGPHVRTKPRKLPYCPKF